MNLRRMSSLMLLAILLVSSLLGGPARTAVADYNLERVLASSNRDFAPGTFGLTGLVQQGGIQLLPLGALERASESTVPLCRPLSGMGTASYPATTVVDGVTKPSTHLYVVGGLTTGFQPVANTCHTTVINETGVTTQDPDTNRWPMDAPRLPLPSGYTGVTQNQALALRSQSGQGYLYSFGGAVTANLLSLEYIFRAPIDAQTGAIGSWITDTLRLPGLEEDTEVQQARHSFALTTYKAADGVTYIYLFGGIRRYRVFISTITQFNRDVWRTRVNADGSLGDGTALGWTRMDDLPIPLASADTCAGLYGSQAVNFPVVGTSAVSQTLYLMGGRYEGDSGCGQPQRASADVYRATLSASGGLTWDSSGGNNIYALPFPLYGHQVLGYNQKLYVVGGYGNPGGGAAAPQTSVLAGYAQEDQNLHVFVDGNFISNYNVLPQARYDHGLIQGKYDNLAIIYTVGGRSNQNTTANDFSDTVFYSIPSVDESMDHGFAPSGVYLSEIVDLRAQARPTSMAWTSTIDNATMDVEIAYRISSAQTGLASAPWQLVDGSPAADRTSQVGTDKLHTVPIAGAAQGRYLQYRAILRSRDSAGSPRLTHVAITLNIPGYPNLLTENASMASITPDGPPQLPSVKLGNKAVGESNEQLLPADIGGAGTFFVDLYLFPPGTTPVTPSYGMAGADALGQVFAELNLAELDADKSFVVPGAEWKQTCYDEGGNPQTDCPLANFKQYMHQAGLWTVIMMVDSGNSVREAPSLDDPWEAQNFYRFTVLSEVQYKRTWLPLLVRPGAPPQAAPEPGIASCAPRLVPAWRGRACSYSS